MGCASHSRRTAPARVRHFRAHGSRYLHNLNGCRNEGRAKRRVAFLNNHREVIAAFGFFTIPSLTFRILYCFFVIEHGRRRILHFNVTEHPASDWIVQQLREALPLPCPYRYVLFDRDTKFGGDVAVSRITKEMGQRIPWIQVGRRDKSLQFD
jgi:hypothetical protein